MPNDFLYVGEGLPQQEGESSANEAYATIPSTLGERTEQVVGDVSGRVWRGLKEYGWYGARAGEMISGAAKGYATGGMTQAARNALSVAAEPPPSKTLQPDEANKLYAPEGEKLFTTPVYEHVAEQMGLSRARQIERDSTLASYANNHSTLTNIGVGLADMLLDPLSAATMLVPGPGEAAIAAKLGWMGLTGVAERAAAREAAEQFSKAGLNELATAAAEKGAAGLGEKTALKLGEGSLGAVAGMTPLIAAQYGLSQADIQDYGWREGLGDLFGAAAFGAIIHAGLVPAGKAAWGWGREKAGYPAEATGAPKPTGAPIDPHIEAQVDQFLKMNAFERQAMMRAATGQVVEGKPVDLTPYGNVDAEAARRKDPETMGKYEPLVAERDAHQQKLTPETGNEATSVIGKAAEILPAEVKPAFDKALKEEIAKAHDEIIEATPRGGENHAAPAQAEEAKPTTEHALSPQEALHTPEEKAPAQLPQETQTPAVGQTERAPTVEEAIKTAAEENHDQRSHLIGGGLEAIDARDIGVDAKTMQFKAGGDEAGVTERLKGIEAWNPMLAGTVIVWRDANGKNWIADGHQRVGLANRLMEAGHPPIKINAFVLKESEGISAMGARVLAAAKNIAEGTGTAVDAAKVLREAKDAGIDLPQMPPKSALVKDGQALSRLSPEAFGAVINEVIPPNYGAVVGRLVTGDLEQQEAIRLLAKTKPDNVRQAELIVKDMLATGVEHFTQSSLFGNEEFAGSVVLERAKIVDAAIRQIKADKKTFKTLVSESDRISGHGANVLDVEANQTRLTEDERVQEFIEKLATRAGPISDALTEVAKQLKSGDINVAGAAKAFLRSVRERSAEIMDTGANAGGAVASAAEREVETHPNLFEPIAKAIEDASPEAKPTADAVRAIAPAVEKITDGVRDGTIPPEADIAPQITEATQRIADTAEAKAPLQEANPPPKGAPAKAPTFFDVRALLPKDSRGNTSLMQLYKDIEARYGKGARTQQLLLHFF